MACNSRLGAITRKRAWQICRNPGIMNHTQRYWRATQLADAMDTCTLKETLHRTIIRATIDYATVLSKVSVTASLFKKRQKNRGY